MRSKKIVTKNLIILITFVIGYIGVSFNIKSNKNNVCTSFEDYYTDRDNNRNCYYNPDYKLTVPDIIRRYGYPCETHYAITADGYNLTVFRIPHSKDNFNKTRKPVFLQHGLATSSSSFLSIGKKALGFILSDEGYDVWVGNLRGTTYSRNHSHLNEDDLQYWDFSFHEHGIYDLPAQINLVNNVTGQKIIYIGYSLGTMSMYVYGTTYPEISSEKISVFVNLSPSAFMGHIKSVIKYLLHLWFIADPVISFATNGKMYSKYFYPSPIFKYFCTPYPFQLKLCQTLEMAAHGFNYEQSDPETLPITYFQMADWTSIKTFTHLSQLYLSDNFQNYDYGESVNMEVYGFPKPPHYNLTKFNIPTYFIRAENDLIVTQESVERLYHSLPNRTRLHDIYVVEDKNFNHLDFLVAKDIVPLVYSHIVNFISKY